MRSSAAGEPELDRVDRTAEQIRERHFLERDHRKLGDWLALERHFYHADRLAVQNRRDERLLRLECQRELVRLALRQRQVPVRDEACVDVALHALPDAQRRYRLSGLVERNGVERLEAPVQELLA